MRGFGSNGFNDDDFNKKFEGLCKSVEKPVKTGMKYVFIAWLVNALVGLMVVGGIGYVVVHFIRKLW